MNSRGVALVETALVMSIVLMLIFGAIQLSMISFSQSAQDGAAFVAAREYAQNAAGGTATAQSAAHQVFAHVNASDITMNKGSTSVTASSATTVAGLGVPGTPGTFPLESRATEPLGAGTPNPSATAYPFSTTGTLSNYRDYASNVPNPNYSIRTAQTFGTGNGVHGFFAEFDCRDKVYSQTSFPAYPATKTASWDPKNGTFRGIYGWDSGTTCA